MDASTVAASEAHTSEAGSSGAPAAPYVAPVIPVPTADDLALTESRKKVLRTLDSRICEQDESTALAAIETALKLVSNILDHPSEPKFRKFRANNPGISKKLLSCPGGQDLLVALGFRVKVIEFEECWIADETSLMMRSLAEASQALDRYRELTRVKLERNAKLRREKLANMNEERARTLAAIEEDKATRRQRAELFADRDASAADGSEDPVALED